MNIYIYIHIYIYIYIYIVLDAHIRNGGAEENVRNERVQGCRVAKGELGECVDPQRLDQGLTRGALGSNPSHNKATIKDLPRSLRPLCPQVVELGFKVMFNFGLTRPAGLTLYIYIYCLWRTSAMVAPGNTSEISALKAAVSLKVSLESVLMRSALISSCSSTTSDTVSPGASFFFSDWMSWPPTRRTEWGNKDVVYTELTFSFYVILPFFTRYCHCRYCMVYCPARASSFRIG